MAHQNDASQYHIFHAQYHHNHHQQQHQQQYQTILPNLTHQQHQNNFTRLMQQQQQQQQQYQQHHHDMNYPLLSSITQHVPIITNNIHITQFPLFDVSDCLTINNLQTALVINNRVANDGIFFPTSYQQQPYAHK
jgi:hypothetical protein